MGNLFSPTLSGVCLQETVDLRSNREDYPAAYKAMKEDGYVDNNFLTAPTREEIRRKINKLEFVLKKGGFHYKPFIVSGEDTPDLEIGAMIYNAVGANTEEEKALGTYWNIKGDKLYIKAELEKPSKKIKHNAKVMQVLVEEGKLITIKPHLTLQVCLSLHAKPFDPLGLVLPMRMIGSLLFGETLLFQERKEDE